MKREIVYNRSNAEIELSIWKAARPKAVLVLAHGASEHIDRYHDFAQYLSANNVTVYGYNHLGHGPKRELREVFFDAENGDKMIVSDLEDVALHVYQHNQTVPLFVMGHSMGSLITRDLALNTKLMFDGIIICGSLHPSKTTVSGGIMLAKTFTKIQGMHKANKMVNKVAFGQLEETLSYNQQNVDDYIADEHSGMLFTNQAIYDLMKIMKRVISPLNIAKTLRTDYFIISGRDDPFSEGTNQLYQFMDLLNRFKINYSYKFYDNMKHEILNEDNHIIVYDDILKFIEKKSTKSLL